LAAGESSPEHSEGEDSTTFRLLLAKRFQVLSKIFKIFQNFCSSRLLRWIQDFFIILLSFSSIFSRHSLYLLVSLLVMAVFPLSTLFEHGYGRVFSALTTLGTSQDMASVTSTLSFWPLQALGMRGV